MNIYAAISNSQKKQLAVLIDPDKAETPYLQQLTDFSKQGFIDFFLVGGSITNKPVDNVIKFLKSNTQTPVLLFPGSALQISQQADAILFLSLISGRNPEFLIGQHVLVASTLKQWKTEVIPTGYILIESQNTTSVEYISNTKPIPADKPQIAVSTAIAGELLGLKLIYLEGGSGANTPINTLIISEVRKNINIPLIVGGGVKDKKTLSSILRAGADIIVVGTACEKNPAIIPQFHTEIKKINAENR